eukprot:9929564-Alexandrium_andersonii.AAC.1
MVATAATVTAVRVVAGGSTCSSPRRRDRAETQQAWSVSVSMQVVLPCRPWCWALLPSRW